MASFFEIGTMVGGISLGFISDRFYQKRAPVGFVAILISFSICMTLTFNYAKISYNIFATFLAVLGFLLGGMHHIIVVTCSADIGTQYSK